MAASSNSLFFSDRPLTGERREDVFARRSWIPRVEPSSKTRMQHFTLPKVAMPILQIGRVSTSSLLVLIDYIPLSPWCSEAPFN